MFYEKILSFTRNRNPLGALFQDKNNAIEKKPMDTNFNGYVLIRLQCALKTLLI